MLLQVVGPPVPTENELILRVIVLGGTALLGGWVLGILIAAIIGQFKQVKEWMRYGGVGRSLRGSFGLLVAALLFNFLIRKNGATLPPFDRLPAWVEAVQLLAGTWIAATLFRIAIHRMEERAAERNERSKRLILPILARAGQAAIFVLGMVSAAGLLGFNLVGVIAGLGIGGIAVALAAKTSVENFFGSVTVLLDIPFSTGDWIKMGDVNGVVEDISMRSTRIRTFDDTLVTVPNSKFIDSAVENYGSRRTRRFVTAFTLDPETPAEKIESLMQQVREELTPWEEITPDTLHFYINGSNEYGIVATLSVHFNVANFAEEAAQRQRATLAVLRHTQTLGIALIKRL